MGYVFSRRFYWKLTIAAVSDVAMSNVETPAMLSEVRFMVIL